MRRFMVIAALFLFLMSGALGLRTRESCDSDPTVITDSQRMVCYRAAAITYAFAGQNETAVDTCRAIWNEFGAGIDPETSDLPEKAEMMSNSCFQEVAKNLPDPDPDICANIVTHSNFQSGLYGTDVSQEICTDYVTRKARLKPENYYGDPDNSNICMMVFILPIILIGTMAVREE